MNALICQEIVQSLKKVAWLRLKMVWDEKSNHRWKEQGNRHNNLMYDY
jgi:hypothetical protein